MEMATFARFFSGPFKAIFGGLFVAAAPFVPPGRAVAVPDLPGVYGPLRPVAAYLVMGFSLENGELLLLEIGRDSRSFRFYRLKKG